jgi:type IV secretory pathway TrbD component
VSDQQFIIRWVHSLSAREMTCWTGGYACAAVLTALGLWVLLVGTVGITLLFVALRLWRIADEMQPDYLRRIDEGRRP